MSPNKKQNFASKKVSNTGLNSSLRAIERYAYCLGYWYFTPRYGFPKSNGAVPTFYNKIQWRGWHHVISFNYQVHSTPHPVLNFLGIYMSPVQWYPSLFFGARRRHPTTSHQPIIHWVSSSTSISEAIDTLYAPYLHFCYDLALETSAIILSTFSGFMTSATPTH